MSLTYNSWFASFFNRVAAISTATPLTPGGAVSSYTDPFWNNEIPNIIDYAEQRIYRDADWLTELVTDQSGILTAAARSFTLPNAIGNWIIVDRINVITPAGLAPNSSGTRNTLQPVSMEMLLQKWPSDQTNQGVPQDFAVQKQTATQMIVWLGPVPDLAYSVEVHGIQRPAALSSATQSTYLTTVYPDLFFACTMIGAAGYMRDFGSQSDNPNMSVSWESQYKTLLESARMEESRKRFRGAGWVSQADLHESKPPRV